MSAIQRRIQQIVVLSAALLVTLLLWAAATPEEAQPIGDPPGPNPTLAAQVVPATPPVSASPTPFTLPPPETQDIAVDRRGQVSATIRRGDLVMALRLPSLKAEAGTVISAEIAFSNQHPDVALSIYSRVQLHGEQHSLEDDWPNLTPSPRGYIPVEPASTVSVPLQLYIPPEAQAQGGAQVWAETVVWVSPGNDGAPSWWMEVGPVFLQVVPAPADRGLSLALEVDEQGWHLQVVSTTQDLQGPFWGAMRYRHRDGSQTWRQLSESLQGEWAERWAPPPVERIEALVTAPNAPATIISRTLTTTSAQQQEYYSFPTIAEAEAFLGRAIPTLQQLPSGAVLEQVTIYRPQQPVRGIDPSLAMGYRLSAGVELRAWRSLGSHASLRPDILEQKQLFPDMREVTIGEAGGLASRRLGEWRLQWELDGARLELSAPASTTSLAELVALAEQVR